MKIRIQVVIEYDDDGGKPETQELVCLSRDTDHLTIEQLGLSLDEAKDILAKTQTTLISHQAEAFVGRHRSCQECGAASPIFLTQPYGVFCNCEMIHNHLQCAEQLMKCLQKSFPLKPG